MPAETLLSRLEGVRPRGEGRWIARSPVGEDRTPSLSIRETSDGTVLIHDWRGYSAAEVVAAVGMELSDLFPPRESSSGPKPKSERPFLSARELAALVRAEVTVVHLAAETLANGGVLDSVDLDRVRLAASRIERITTGALG